MSRVRKPRDEWSRINDLETRVANLERSNALNLATIQDADGNVVWSSQQAVSMALAPISAALSTVASVTTSSYAEVGTFAFADTNLNIGLTPSVSIPVWTVPPAGGTVKLRLVDQSGVGVVICEQTGIGTTGYVILTGELGTTVGSTGDVRLIEVDMAIDSGSGTATARLDATGSVH